MAFLYCYIIMYGAGDRGRTGTVSLPPDFESGTSANSIIPAIPYLRGISALRLKYPDIISHTAIICNAFLKINSALQKTALALTKYKENVASPRAVMIQS